MESRNSEHNPMKQGVSELQCIRCNPEFFKKKKTLTETERQREIGTEIKDLKRVDGGGVKIQIKV